MKDEELCSTVNNLIYIIPNVLSLFRLVNLIIVLKVWNDFITSEYLKCAKVLLAVD